MKMKPKLNEIKKKHKTTAAKNELKTHTHTHKTNRKKEAKITKSYNKISPYKSSRD